MTTIITIVTIASVAVTQMLPVAVPPRCVPNSVDTAGIGSRPRMLTVRTKKKTLQMYLMKRSVCSCERRLGDFLAEVLADGFEHVRRAGRHQRVDAALAPAALDQHRHERDQQHAGQRSIAI